MPCEKGFWTRKNLLRQNCSHPPANAFLIDFGGILRSKIPILRVKARRKMRKRIVVGQFGSTPVRLPFAVRLRNAFFGSGGSSVKIRRNHHYRQSRNTRRRAIWKLLLDMKSVAVFRLDKGVSVPICVNRIAALFCPTEVKERFLFFTCSSTGVSSIRKPPQPPRCHPRASISVKILRFAQE